MSCFFLSVGLFLLSFSGTVIPQWLKLLCPWLERQESFWYHVGTASSGASAVLENPDAWPLGSVPLIDDQYVVIQFRPEVTMCGWQDVTGSADIPTNARALWRKEWKRSLLTRPSCPPADPIGQGTGTELAAAQKYGYRSVMTYVWITLKSLTLKIELALF